MRPEHCIYKTWEGIEVCYVDICEKLCPKHADWNKCANCGKPLKYRNHWCKYCADCLEEEEKRRR